MKRKTKLFGNISFPVKIGFNIIKINEEHEESNIEYKTIGILIVKGK